MARSISMTDQQAKQLIKKLVTLLCDVHVEFKAQQRVLLDWAPRLAMTPAGMQQQIKNAKKVPAIRAQTRKDYARLLKLFELEIRNSDLHSATKLLLTNVEKLIR
jgi:hypothetical protein